MKVESAPQGVIATLFPAYFAFVMATGIISISSDQEGVGWLADVLFALAAIGYVILLVLLAARIVKYPRLFLADATDHAKGWAFLTTVAATNVLGSAAGIVHGWWTLSWVLWWVSLPMFLVLVYLTLIAVVIGTKKPGLDAGINGTWFLLPVSAQSIAVLGALLLRQHDDELLAFGVISLFSLGIVLYLILMTMEFLRWTFDPLDPLEVSPPAWIAAGSMAITVLAGSNILLAAPTSTRIQDAAPYLEGMTMLAWATATFWLPLIVAIGVWRHLVKKVPLRYHPSYWALVFPIGMYGAATFDMRDALHLGALGWVPTLTLVVALVTWTVTFFGLGRSLSRPFFHRSPPRAEIN